MDSSQQLVEDSSQQLVEMKIIRQPNSVYRMRYKTDTRQTNLLSDDLSNHSTDDNYNLETIKEATGCVSSTSFSSTTASFSKAKKLPPKLQLINGTGPAILRVTCVFPDPPYYVHPNFLFGSNCTNGFAEIYVEHGASFVELKDIRIELVKRSEIKSRIEKLKSLNVDPYRCGYDIDYTNVDLGRLRLCFELKCEFFSVAPILSNIISTNRQKISILIQKKTNLKSPCIGGDDVVLFVKKLEKDQKPILAKFYDDFGWSCIIEIKDIHYRCAMMFKAPPYKNESIESEVKAYLKLVVPFEKDSNKNSSDEGVSMSQDKYESEAIEFVYTLILNENQPKKRKYDESDSFDNYEMPFKFDMESLYQF